MKTKHIPLQLETFALVLFLSVASALTGCASWREHSFRIPFQYPYSGIGEQPVHGTVVVKEVAEQKIISRAIINALQHESFGIDKPKLAPGEVLPTGEHIDTDEVPLSREWLPEHNARNRAELHLPTDRHYQLTYRLSYNIGDKEFHFKASAILQYKALHGHKWRKYEGPYSGAFFVGKLEDRIRAVLANWETKNGEFSQ